jgi:hypothetical protein
LKSNLEFNVQTVFQAFFILKSTKAGFKPASDFLTG